jgi:hypothetical protein
VPLRRRLEPWLLALAVASGSDAHAIVLGGGAAEKDCRLLFVGADATAGASGVVCVDGDAACDADATADGTCRFDVALCIGTVAAGCDPVALDRIAAGGVAPPAPVLPAADGTCGEPASIEVTVGSGAAGTVRAYLGSELREVDYLHLCCVVAASPLDAASCAVAVDPLGSGCEDLPDKVERKLTRARERVAAAVADAAIAPKMLQKAARLARRVRAIGQRIARRDDCGFALGLMMSHAEAMLEAAATGSAAGSPPVP